MTKVSKLSKPDKPEERSGISFKTDPKVTIVMPVRNGGHYFAMALESALAQTYANTEIVVVNDGSDDGGETERIALQHAARVRYFRQENKGVAGALNTAIANMTGDIFTWLSHDDIYLPHKTEAQVLFHRRIGRPDAILFSNYSLINADGDVFFTTDISRETLSRVPLLPLHRGYVNGCTLYMPAEIIKKHYPFDERLRFTQDYQLWLQISQFHDFFLQKDVLVHYRSHPGQDSHKPGAAEERNRLHIFGMECRSPIQRVLMSGSEERFFREQADFLKHIKNTEAAEYATERMEGSSHSDTLVSVVMPCAEDDAGEAARSVLNQTHRKLELLVVGSEPPTGEMAALAVSDRRVRTITAHPGEDLRNVGMAHARGSYIAFIDVADRFRPGKIGQQLAAMTREGRLVSHSSYTRLESPGAGPGTPSGGFAGDVCPQVLWHFPVAMSTVMVHACVHLGGFRFTRSGDTAADWLAMIWLSRRHSLLGIEEPLSEIGGAGAPAFEASPEKLDTIVAELSTDPLHRRNAVAFERLTEMRRKIQSGG